MGRGNGATSAMTASVGRGSEGGVLRFFETRAEATVPPKCLGW
jgi:hypothetical protein